MERSASDSTRNPDERDPQVYNTHMRVYKSFVLRITDAPELPAQHLHLLRYYLLVLLLLLFVIAWFRLMSRKHAAERNNHHLSTDSLRSN